MSRYGSGYEDSRRRDSGRSSGRDDGSRNRRDRRSSPGPSRDRSPPPRPRDENELPSQFGRGLDEVPEDENNVLQKMKNSFQTSPLGCIYKCIDGSRKLKVWTRNFKEVRGICTGYVLAFDKHWNLIMSDVDEVYLKPRRRKTPFLGDIEDGTTLPVLPPKVPKKKKTEEEKKAAAERVAAEKAAAEKAAAERAAAEKAAAEKAAAEGEKPTKPKKKRRRNRKKGPITGSRAVNQFFIRGDNIVMVSILDKEENESGGESSS